MTNTSLFRAGDRGVSVGGGLSSEELSFARALMDYNKQVLCHGVRPDLSSTMYGLVQTFNHQVNACTTIASKINGTPNNKCYP